MSPEPRLSSIDRGRRPRGRDGHAIGDDRAPVAIAGVGCSRFGDLLSTPGQLHALFKRGPVKVKAEALTMQDLPVLAFRLAG